MSDDRARPETVFDPYPDPNLSAQDVVRLQLDALQNDDIFAGNGLLIAYRFASPINRRALGSLKRFSQIVYSRFYRPLIGFDHATVSALPIGPRKSVAIQRVWIYQRGKIVAIYRFSLSCQIHEPYEGCWLVDEVIRES
jgi:hypothetical protein